MPHFFLMNKTMEELRQKAASLPLCPGVYLMKNKGGTVIYVGKSRKLRQRVSQYFSDGDATPKTKRLVASIADFDYIVCDSEIEALSLENTLIKQYAPRYNIKLKDAKSYPYIALTAEPFPRIVVTRARRNDGARYFGPYASASDAKLNAETVSRIFRLPRCRHRFPEETGKIRPCLYKQMGRCLAPCLPSCSKEEYAEAVKGAAGVLSGNTHKTVESLRETMLAFSEKEEYEAAARFRDAILALESLGAKQKVLDEASVFLDAWGMTGNEYVGALSMLSVRSGALNRKRDFTFPSQEVLDENSALGFIAAYYGEGEDIPPKILLAFSVEAEELSLLSDFLSAKRGRRVAVLCPKRGKGRALCALAEKNAKEAAEKYGLRVAREEETTARLASLLNLSATPTRIELYDISSLGAEGTTAGLIVWENGRLYRQGYRLFHIKTVVNDDYGAMREVLSRRFAHGADEEDFGKHPDLILLDGGKQHVRVGREILAEMGISVPLFGLVKNDKHKTEALHDGEGTISILREQSVFVFLYRLQEEVHRFTVSAVMRAKTKRLRTSSLEEIAGIGRERARLLLAYFGNLRRIKSASVEELASVKGMTAPAAAAVYTHFHPEAQEDSL